MTNNHETDCCDFWRETMGNPEQRFDALLRNLKEWVCAHAHFTTVGGLTALPDDDAFEGHQRAAVRRSLAQALDLKPHSKKAGWLMAVYDGCISNRFGLTETQLCYLYMRAVIHCEMFDG